MGEQELLQLYTCAESISRDDSTGFEVVMS